MGADRVGRGPLNSLGTNPVDQEAIYFDSQNNILETSGDSHVLTACQKALSVLAAQTALTAITTAQNLISQALNAGALNKIGRTILVEGTFFYTSPGTTAPVVSLALVLGGVTLCTITLAALSTTASTNMPVQFQFQFNVVSTGASATIESHGYVNANISANTPAAAAVQFLDTNVAVSSAVNLVNAATLAVQISSTLAVTSAQLRQATIEVVN
jgi:hypothetical protein